MTDRTVYNSSSGVFTGAAYADQIAQRLKSLFDGSCFPLTSVAGVDTLTATLDPAFDADVLVTGMRFTLTWPADNTGAMTLNINATGAVPVLDASGAAMIAGAAVSGTRAMLEYVGGDFRVLTSGVGSGAMATPQTWTYTSSGTWTKPAGYDADALVIVEAWGGGAGGANASGGGGGGGGYASRAFRLGDLPSSVTVTIGAGGAVNAAGGTTTFGALLSAYGGGKGAASSTGGGGAGGGPSAVGGNASGSTGGIGGGAAPGGNGGTGAGANNAPACPNIWGGGGGGGAGTNAGYGNGGAAVFGGGGGAGNNNSTTPSGGASVFGGRGGDEGSAGTAPAGGGGYNSAGARGEVRVRLG